MKNPFGLELTIHNFNAAFQAKYEYNPPHVIYSKSPLITQIGWPICGKCYFQTINWVQLQIEVQENNICRSQIILKWRRKVRIFQLEPFSEKNEKTKKWPI